MRSPIPAPPAPSPRTYGPQAVAPVAGMAQGPAREGTRDERSFAELLAQAEAVRDLIDLRHRHAAGSGGWQRGVRGALQSAASLLGRTPWLGLPLLQRPPAPAVHARPRVPQAEQAPAATAD